MKPASSPHSFDITPFLTRDEGQHYDRKSLYEGPPAHKRARDRRAVRDQVAEYPDFAWREAILNAVAHRDYAVQGRGVEVWLFDDRMEVTSPGALLPSVSIERLLAGERTHEVWVMLRNQVDADGGELDADRQELTAVERDLIAKLGARPRMEKLRIVLLELLKRQPWTSSELARALHRDPENLVRRHLGPMVESGQIKRTRPDAPTDPNQAYYAAEGYWGPVVGGEE